MKTYHAHVVEQFIQGGLAVMPDNFTDARQLSTYAEAQAKHAIILKHFMQTRTIDFMTVNQHRLQA